MEYELIKTDFSSYVKRLNKDGTITLIPLDESNADYQEYLAANEAKAK
jgi:hypothetical protein